MRTITNQMIKDFEVYLCEEERSDNTIQGYLRNLRFFVEWLGGREIDKSVVLAYKKELCQQYAPASVNAALSALNSFFAFMDWYECRVKTLKIQRQLFTNGERELTKTDYEKLLSAAKRKGDKRLYYLMQTLAATGIRISELQFIDRTAVQKGQAVISCKGKMRVVLLPKQLCKMLKRYIKAQGIKKGSVFQTRNGKPLNRSNVWKLLKSLCEYAGVAKRKVFPHNFRHLFARTFYAMQKDIVRLADILGHSSINTTRVYTVESGTVHLMQLQKLGLLRC